MDDAYRQRLVAGIAPRDGALAWVRLFDGGEQHVLIVGFDVDDDGVTIHWVDEPTYRIPWDDVFGVEAERGDHHVAFLDRLPDADGALVRALAERGPTTRALVQTALRVSRTQAGELQPIVADLSADDVEALRATALEVLRSENGVGRGLLLALGLVGAATDALVLGDELCAIDNTENAWRWRWSLEALRLIGTRDAHMQIQRVTMQSPNPPVIDAAREKLLHIAGDLKVPVWEVQDELVPACGLDVDGGVDLSFGERRFELVLNEELRPMLLERPGHRRHVDLPEPGPGDDASLAASARATWSVVREQLIEAVPVQVHRFEEALAQQTRWDGKQWDRVVRRHPLLVHLVPRAIWGTYSRGGRRLQDTFRMAPDRTLWGPDDEPFELDVELVIGLPHPSEIADDVRDAWGEILADYEVVTMFPQIDRPVYRPDEDKKKEAYVDFDIGIPGEVGLTLLHRRGWTDHESWGSHYLQKVFRNRDVKAVLRCEIERDEATGVATEVRLSQVYWERYLGFPQTHFQLRDVSPVPYSETIYELEQLRMPQETGGWSAVLGQR